MPAADRVSAPCLCGGRSREVLFTYEAPPAGEPRYAFSSAGVYHRRIDRCPACGHCVAVHDLDTTRLYEGDYDDAIYGPRGIQGGYERILALDPSRSDNAARVRRMISFFADRIPVDRPRTVLDVGSGLCVFLHRMKEAGWSCTAIDPDPRAARHAADVVGVTAHCGDFATAEVPGRFDLVTFNKVLEHVPDPVDVLARAHRNLPLGGVVHVEVPDAEAAAEAGAGREEWFVDHLHVFSAASLALLLQRAGFRVLDLRRLHEPSGKFTLYAFGESVAPSGEASA